MGTHRDAKVAAQLADFSASVVTTSTISSEPEVNEEEFFKNNSENAGLAVIFNQYEFEGQKDKTRDGAEVDTRNLKNTLEKYGFKVDEHNNLTTEEIEEKLDSVSKMDHKKNNCLVIVMMSHGNEYEQIQTKDGTLELDSLFKPFHNHNCPALRGKPKIFFIQACRGSLPDFGSKLQKKFEEELKVKSGRRMQVGSEEDRNIPIMADFLIMFSSAQGYPSFREEDKGSWLIQGICDEFRKYLNRNDEKDILRMLNGVSRYVAFHKEGYETDGKGDTGHKQMPVIMSMLTKTFVFNQKHIRRE